MALNFWLMKKWVVVVGEKVEGKEVMLAACSFSFADVKCLSSAIIFKSGGCSSRTILASIASCILSSILKHDAPRIAYDVWHLPRLLMDHFCPHDQQYSSMNTSESLSMDLLF